MNAVEDLLERLARDASPVRPLRSPLTRALSWLIGVAILSGLAIALWGDARALFSNYRGREQMMAFEMSAMLATGLLAIVSAFVVAVPGRSRGWAVLPLAPLAAWLLLSGAGCYRDLVRNGAAGLEVGHSFDCLVFIVTVSGLLGVPLIALLARARPIDPLPVALLGGLGSAALAAFILQFFHPFAVTLIDFGFHLVAVLLVILVSALLNRRTLSPA